MKNKEKWVKQLAEIALATAPAIAVDVRSGEPRECRKTACRDCEFCVNCNRSVLLKWAEEECKEKPTISRSDRTFLDYIPDDYKYMARDEDGMLFTYKERPRRRSEMWIYDSELFGIHKAKVRFPMVKWENKEPWLIEDLKKLEVVDEY